MTSWAVCLLVMLRDWSSCAGLGGQRVSGIAMTEIWTVIIRQRKAMNSLKWITTVSIGARLGVFEHSSLHCVETRFPTSYPTAKHERIGHS